MIAGMKECVEELAMRRGITKVEAQSIMEDVVNLIADKCVEGGVSFKGKFTIKHKIQKGRTGRCAFNNKEWTSKDKTTLSISVGNELDFNLNYKG